MTKQPIKTGVAIPEQPEKHPRLCNCINCMPESVEKQFEQPNQNLTILEQVDGCVIEAIGLMGLLRPQTENVKSCIATLKSWRDNNLKHLRKAFE